MRNRFDSAITPDFCDALRHVLQYLMEAERQHYEACEPGAQEDHIYLDLMLLEGWLGGVEKPCHEECRGRR